MIGRFGSRLGVRRSLWPAIAVAVLVAVVPLWMIVADERANASFSSSHKLGENRLTTATAELRAGWSAEVPAAKALFPGDRRGMELNVTNVGSLPLQVSVELLAEDGSEDLAAALEIELHHTGACESSSLQTSAGTAGALDDIRLAVGQSTTLCLVTFLPLTASNDLQGRSSSFSILLNGVHDLDAS